MDEEDEKKKLREMMGDVALMAEPRRLSAAIVGPRASKFNLIAGSWLSPSVVNSNYRQEPEYIWDSATIEGTEKNFLLH